MFADSQAAGLKSRSLRGFTGRSEGCWVAPGWKSKKFDLFVFPNIYFCQKLSDFRFGGIFPKNRKSLEFIRNHIRNQFRNTKMRFQENILSGLLEKMNSQWLTMYKKHRAFVLTPKFCVYLQSPLNIKFSIYRRKDKSKIFIFS